MLAGGDSAAKNQDMSRLLALTLYTYINQSMTDTLQATCSCIRCGRTLDKVLMLWEVESTQWCSDCCDADFPAQAASGLLLHPSVPNLPQLSQEDVISILADGRLVATSARRAMRPLREIRVTAYGTYYPLYSILYKLPNGDLFSTLVAGTGQFVSKGPVIPGRLEAAAQTSSDAAVQTEDITNGDAPIQAGFIGWDYDEMEGMLQEFELPPVPPPRPPTPGPPRDREASQSSPQPSGFYEDITSPEDLGSDDDGDGAPSPGLLQMLDCTPCLDESSPSSEEVRPHIVDYNSPTWERRFDPPGRHPVTPPRIPGASGGSNHGCATGEEDVLFLTFEEDGATGWD